MLLCIRIALRNYYHKSLEKEKTTVQTFIGPDETQVNPGFLQASKMESFVKRVMLDIWGSPGYTSAK